MEQPDDHYSLVGGNLVINNPKKSKHAGTYICVVKNPYGVVISKEARLKFGCERVVPARSLHPFIAFSYFAFVFDADLEEFPQVERDPVHVKEGQGAVLLCVPPKAWPGE